MRDEKDIAKERDRLAKRANSRAENYLRDLARMACHSLTWALGESESPPNVHTGGDWPMEDDTRRELIAALFAFAEDARQPKTADETAHIVALLDSLPRQTGTEQPKC
jgi:hypothetical protein